MKRHHRFLSVLMIGLLASNQALADRHRAINKKKPAPAAADRRDLGKIEIEDDDQPHKKDDSDGPELAALPIKLDDVIEAAVQRAPDLMRAKTDRAAAAGDAGAARRGQSWILGGNVDYTRNAQADHVDVAPFGQVADDKITAALSLGRKLPTGGEISFQLGLVRDLTEINVPANFQAILDQQQGAAATQVGTPGDIDHIEASQARIGAKLKQPLLRGLGSDVALAEEKKADLNLAVATIKTQLAAEEMVKDLVTDYYELQYAAYEVDTRAESLALAQKQEQLTREELRAGTAPTSQLNTVTYEIATREEALLRAQTTLSQKSLDVRRKAGLEIDRRNIVLRPSEAFEIGNDDFDVEETIKRSHHANRRLVTLALQKKASEVDVAVAKNGMLPQLDATLSGAIVGSGADPGAAFNSIGNVDGFEVMAGLTFQIELSDSAKRSYEASLARRHKIDIERDDLERQIDVEVANAVQSVQVARKRVALADRAIVVANENALAERLNFQATHSNNFQVMQRQSQLLESRLRRGRAVADYRVAVAQLQFLSGTILQQYGVSALPHGDER